MITARRANQAAAGGFFVFAPAGGGDVCHRRGVSAGVAAGADAAGRGAVFPHHGQPGAGDGGCHLPDRAAYCSKNRIGALIAIERDVGLGGLIENGTI